jgi:hypothetical protein
MKAVPRRSFVIHPNGGWWQSMTCYIVDDVTKPEYYGNIILSHIILAKLAITFERNILIAIAFPRKLLVLNRVT